MKFQCFNEPTTRNGNMYIQDTCIYSIQAKPWLVNDFRLIELLQLIISEEVIITTTE